MKDYIITKEAMDTYPRTEKIHFLNSSAKRQTVSLGDLTGLNGMGFHIIEVHPQFWTTEEHVHSFEEECIYVLEGQGQAKIGDNYYPIKTGDFIGYRASGESHTIKNTGTDILKCICVGQRLNHDIADYPQQKKRLYRYKNSDSNLVDIESINIQIKKEAR